MATSISIEDWDPQKMLDLYLHDYLMKKNMHGTAAIFRQEANVASCSVAIDAPEGFLHEWWTLLYDMYASRQQKHQAEKGKAPVGSEQMMGNGPQNVQRNSSQTIRNLQRLEQVHVGLDIDKVLGQPPASQLSTRMIRKEHYLGNPVGNFDPNKQMIDVNKLNPSKSAATISSYLKQQMCNQGQQLDENRTSINDVGKAGKMDPNLCGVQNDIFQMAMSRDAVVNKGVKPILPDLWHPNTFTQPSNRPKQLTRFANQYQQNISDQAPSLTSGNQKSALTGGSYNFDDRNLIIPEYNTTGKDSQVMAQAERGKGQQQQPDQYMKQQLLADGRKGKRLLNARARDKILGSANAAFNKLIDENVESFLSTDDDKDDIKSNPFSTLERISTVCNSNCREGFTFEEVGCLRSSKNKLSSCHFSSDGKILVSAGHEKKILIWKLENFNFISTSEGHSHLVTDVRFRPGSTIFATSSYDKTVKIWDATSPNQSLFKLLGHTEPVMSVDFHQRNSDLLCSCDVNDEIRLWNVNNCVCLRVSKGASKEVVFQPQGGKLLATASGNNVKLIDFDSYSIQYNLKGHAKEVNSICWDSSGKYLASVSEDSARLWSLASGGNCIYELQSNGNKFLSCTFHPGYAQLLIIGGYQSLELWNPNGGSKTWSVAAHNGLIPALANSPETEMIASASHDHSVKLWK